MTIAPPIPLIAIVDDEAKLRQALGRLLRLHDFEVAFFESGDDFLGRGDQEPFPCLLLDLHLPGTADGFQVLETLRREGNPTRVILMTAHDQPGHEQRARLLGAVDYLLKPVDEETLIEAIHRAISSPGASR